VKTPIFRRLHYAEMDETDRENQLPEAILEFRDSNVRLLRPNYSSAHNGGDGLAFGDPHRSSAGTRGLAIEQDSTCSALAFAAAVFCARQVQVIS